MSEGGDDSSEDKTEEPSQRRLEEAEKKGQITFSREVNNFFVILALALIIGWMAPTLMADTMQLLAPFITRPHDIEVDPAPLKELLTEVSLHSALIMAGPMALLMLLVLGAAFAQSKLIFAVERIKPKFEKISPMKGLKRMFSMRSVVEFGKGMLKIIVVGYVGYIAVRPQLTALEELPTADIAALSALLSSMSIRMLIGISCIMFLIAILDYVYQRFDYMKQLRMSKQEMKEEYKQQEGDPHIKGRLRQIRMERAKKRMMAAVPKADVIITNPTHYAIALTYETGVMQAPIIVAMGVDKVAHRIREVAEEHDIPIVENPPLARALWATGDLDQEIPYEHYKAVAEVIGYVYRLKGKV